jgi:hypothetical protein
MAMVLIEEVLCSMDEAKALLDQAFLILAEVVEEMTPATGPELQDVCAQKVLSPLESCLGEIEALMNEMATEQG